MALVHDAKREINAKIVYLGPKGAGKSTALRQIYGRLDPERRSELKSMDVSGHSLLFFDYTYPQSPGSDSYSVRFHIYTLIAGEGVPPWKMLLKGADGVVMLADSAASRKYANLESCAILMDAIAHYGRKADQVAISLQCNKRDMADALPLEAMGADLLTDIAGAPFPVTAITGDGLLEGLDRIFRMILADLGQDAAVDAISCERADVDCDEFEDDDEAFDHCSADGPELTVETNGTPVVINSSTIEIPLRIRGAACGKSAEFRVTVSVAV